MSKLNDLKRKFDQREYNRRWQQHYNDYCHNYLGGRQAEGNEHDRAAAFADEMMDDE